MSVDDDYSLEFLVKTFSEHEVRSRENQKEQFKNFMENNPGAPVPDHMIDDFNLPKALLSICNEILALKSSKD
jgi:hypothetical protein